MNICARVTNFLTAGLCFDVFGKVLYVCREDQQCRSFTSGQQIGLESFTFKSVGLGEAGCGAFNQFAGEVNLIEQCKCVADNSNSLQR